MDFIDELGSQFMEQTKYKNMGATPQNQGAPYPVYVKPPDPGTQLIDLPDPASIDLGHVDLRQIVEGRRSVRRYQTQPLSLEELSYLLWMTQGVKRISEKSGLTLRTVPSAGARHPFETYLSINLVEGLQTGLYRFVAQNHQLEVIRLGTDINSDLTAATGDQQHVAASAVTFIWVAHPYRTSWRYNTRAYRYIHLDAGHVCQNLHLAAESIDCGICAIGAYDDDHVHAILGIDGKAQFAIYLASLGKKIAETEA